MQHAEVENLITRYCNRVLPLFADKWNRWPQGTSAITIADALDKSSALWKKMGFNNIAEDLSIASKEVRNRA